MNTDEINNDEHTSDSYGNTQPDDDFDTSLLCPDVILDEKIDAIVTSNDTIDEHDDYMNASPDDYNITGIKARFELNDAEGKIRNEIYKFGNPVQNTKIHCTACNSHLGSALSEIKNVFVHPVLSVLLCKECFDFYTGGTFEKDEDGAEMFCKWCGQGGQVFCCNKCPKVFCKLCIRLHFSSIEYAAIRDSDYWECFACNPTAVMNLKVQCFEFARYVRNEVKKFQNLQDPNFYMDMDHSQCCLKSSLSQKRKSKNRDPDFVPYFDSSERNPKRLKVPKKEYNWDIGQIRNTESVNGGGTGDMLVPTSFNEGPNGGNFSIKLEPTESEMVSAKSPKTIGPPTQNLLPAAPKIPYKPSFPIPTPTSSNPTNPTKILLQKIGVNQFYHNKLAPTPASFPQPLPVSRTVTIGSSASQNAPAASQTIYNTYCPAVQDLPVLRTSAHLGPSSSRNVLTTKPSTSQPPLLHFKFPQRSLLPSTAKLNISNVNRPPVYKTAVIGSGPTLNWTSANQLRSEMENYIVLQQRAADKKMEEYKTFMEKSRKLDRLKLSASLANSSCASSILSIYQLCGSMKTVKDLLVVHKSFEKSLKVMTDSLVVIRSQLTGRVSFTLTDEGLKKTDDVRTSPSFRQAEQNILK